MSDRIGVIARLCVVSASLTIAIMIAASSAVIADSSVMATLTPSQENPAVASQGSGTGYLFISSDELSMAYTVSFQGLSGPVTSARIFWGTAGQAGSPMFNLVVTPGTLFGQLSQSDLQGPGLTWKDALTALRSGRAFINLSTAAHPNGELRGQFQSTSSGTASPTPARSSVASQAPQTDTQTPFAREQATDLLPLLAILIVAAVGGAVAVAKVRPTP